VADRRSTIDGLTAEELPPGAAALADFITRRLEESGGRMTLVQYDKDGNKQRVYHMTGVKVTSVTSEETEGDADLMKVEYLPFSK
jgi:hypothetical protein